MTNATDYYKGGLAVAAYDLFTGGGLLAGDIEFYLDCAHRFGGPILEIGTGTGRILLPLANAGYDVIGLDISNSMLAMAAAKLTDHPDLSARVQFVNDDMTNFDLKQKFPLIINTARSFQHLLTPDDQRKALLCIHQHLMPGGYLVLDLFDPYFELLFANDLAAPAPREMHDPLSNHQIRRTMLARYTDPMHQTVQEVLRFEAFDKAGGLVACEETSWTLRWSMRQEIAYLLELCGFEVVEQFSDFSGAPPAYGREQLWIARSI
ncbi:class I SAM-dependent methyltransferase [Agrobacterium rhizogenes]|uniref:class I SAM-dependent methyltransferase n=1 Tax=Rhizobium rhizogenes TaxID=359 RepID=UPI001572C5B9|nr:class I SAM-dependent methyltransferase [Rhizobium rhizogenes]NTG50465.1 class I SAM-dependent methyltransferase [Rhizobium rhizogenes]